jgi:CMP-N,N'-diacetyllegionaminic acid synthase
VTAIGVIPARGGSKGIPRKNLAPIGGEPLVARAVRIALEARLLDRLVVSTDNDEIAGIAAAAGAEVVRRPAELADDDAPTEAALIHALDSIDGPEPTWTVTLEPTSPFRSAALIDRCIAFAEEKSADAVYTVSPTTDIVGALADGVFVPLLRDAPRRRQLRQPLYRESSTVYVTRTTHLRATRSVLADPLYAVPVSPEEALDVNTPIDLLVVRAIIESAGQSPVP